MALTFDQIKNNIKVFSDLSPGFKFRVDQFDNAEIEVGMMMTATRTLRELAGSSNYLSNRYITYEIIFRTYDGVYDYPEFCVDEAKAIAFSFLNLYNSLTVTYPNVTFLHRMILEESSRFQFWVVTTLGQMEICGKPLTEIQYVKLTRCQIDLRILESLMKIAKQQTLEFDQPETFREGLQKGYTVFAERLSRSAKLLEPNADEAYPKTLIKGIVPAICQPVLGVAGASKQLFLGIKNQILGDD